MALVVFLYFFGKVHQLKLLFLLGCKKVNFQCILYRIAFFFSSKAFIFRSFEKVPLKMQDGVKNG